jgi:YbgC/YbaW family acyl-CoA thioester hydrolase
MKRDDFRFLEPLRVRWAEIDMQKIVFNGHYLMYIDTAVAGYWRAMAMPYQETMESLGGDLYVRKATLEYLGSARYDDRIDVGVRCERFGNSSIRLATAVFRGETALVAGELLYVFADPATQTSRPVPQALREAMQAFEAREPMVQVQVGAWSELERDAHPLRKAVFVDEQRIPAELEWDAADATALHALARNRFGMPVATGRLVDIAPGVGKVGRMAVHQGTRGGGVGRAVLEALAAAGRRRGVRELVLHAQRTAVPFYLRAGFVPRGAPFDEAGIAHQEMVRAAVV